MTELTFAELTALIAVNGLVINDRYLITDKNWTIIAITTSSYRIIVPIVTEVTYAQLEALVAANGLNEGLQYKVTDQNWLLIATSSNTLKSATGLIKMNNGTILNSAITSDFLQIETGICTDNLEGSMVPIIVPSNYYMIDFVANVLNGLVEEIMVTAFVESVSFFSHKTQTSGIGVYRSFISNANGVPASNRLSNEIYYTATANGGNGFNLIIRFEKGLF